MDYRPIRTIDQVEAQSAAIGWLLHERIEAAGGSCAVVPHPIRPTIPNTRLSVLCQAGDHNLCSSPPAYRGADWPWRCRCLCHHAGDR